MMRQRSKLLALTAAAAVLLSACGSYGGDIDLTPEPYITEDTSVPDDYVDPAVMQPVIMPEKDDEEYAEYADILGEDACVPGCLYLFSRRLDRTKSKLYLLSAKKYDRDTGLYQCAPEHEGYYNNRYVYAMTEDKSEFVRVEKRTSLEKVVYAPQNGRIEFFAASGYDTVSKGVYFFLSDGKEVAGVDADSGNSYLYFSSENGVTDVKGMDFVLERYNAGAYEAYLCKDCGNSGVLWADGNGQYRWYHPHSDENTLIDFEKTYFPFYSLYKFFWTFTADENVSVSEEDEDYSYYNYIFGAFHQLEIPYGVFEHRAFEKAQLWVVKTGAEGKPLYNEKTLLLDNVKYAENAGDYIAAIVHDDSGDHLITVNTNDGTTETVYEAAEGGLSDFFTVDEQSIIYRDGTAFTKYSFSTEEKETIGFEADEDVEILCSLSSDSILVRANSSVMTLDFGSMSRKKLFDAENGIAEVSLVGVNTNELLRSYFPDEDFSDAYFCQECSEGQAYGEMPFVWEDNGGNWFWYHPHSGELMSAEVTEYPVYVPNGNSTDTLELTNILYIRKK